MAGKSSMPPYRRSRPWDHPRPCGEKRLKQVTGIAALESPPPMRGKGEVIIWNTSLMRITPAHAGKRQTSHLLLYRGRDHPRPCGEKVYVRPRVYLDRGSPPPMRGKVGNGWICPQSARITPAHAGKRLTVGRDNTYHPDHPRPCGEKSSTAASAFGIQGSPPPMRGKVSINAYVMSAVRITPAHAGKSCIYGDPDADERDHPRPRGEKYIIPRTLWEAHGSPPPTRGKERQPPDRRGGGGITPAHAGKRYSALIAVNVW